MTKKQRRLRNRLLLTGGLFAAVLLLDVLFLHKCEVYITFIPYFAVYLLVGYDVLHTAGRNILRGQVFDENLLMTLATVGAFVLSFLPGGEREFAEAVFVLLFYQVGELFQSIAVGKSRRSIRALLDMRPDTANLLRDGETVTVPAADIKIGEHILVRVGERIPLDGVVVEGTSTLDTAALTGESLPREVTAGTPVYSGSVNLTAGLTLEVTRLFSESTASKILELVQSTAEKKSKSESFISKFARYYTPFVVVAALLLAFLPPLFSGHFAAEFLIWLHRALTFLVISCPCALVISVPLSFFGGIGNGGRQGILVKGSAYLEALASVKTVVFDKTGTLTTGRFSVESLSPIGVTEESFRYYLAAAECSSTHPIARVLSELSEAGRAAARTDSREYSGRGVSATVDGVRVLAGNLRLMQENGVSLPEALLPLPCDARDTRAQDISPDADATLVLLALNGVYAGYLRLADTPRDTSAATLSALRARGIESVMLTGDREEAAGKLAVSLGISRYYAGLLPSDKVERLEQLLSEVAGAHKVAFVGDGINDAPVLTRSDVGIAMGGLGSDAAIEAADVVLMDDHPEKLLSAIDLSQKTLRIVKENIVFTLAVKAAVLALGALGLASLWLAVFADVGVAVLAILNAMRTLQ